MIKKYIRSTFTELGFLTKEIIALVIMLVTLSGGMYWFFGEKFAMVLASYGSAKYSLPHALSENVMTPLVLITLVMVVGFYFVLMGFLAKPRAETFYTGTVKPNHLSGMRDYLAVIFFVFIACTNVRHSFDSRYFVTVATLIGVILAWWSMAIVVNMGGYGEKIIDTIKDLAWVAGLLLAGKVAPAVLEGFTWGALQEYFIELGIIFTIGPGIGMLSSPGLGITLNLSKNRAIAHLQGYALTLFIYFGTIAFAMLPGFLLLIPAALVIGIAAAMMGLTGEFSSFNAFAGSVFNNVIIPKENGMIPFMNYSPVMYVIAFFQHLFRNALQHWTGAIGLVSFLLSLHYSLWKYRTRMGPVKGDKD